MNINWVTIDVKDMAAAEVFYGDYLGMEKAEEFPAGPSTKIVFYQAANGMKIELICDENAQPSGVNPDVTIGVSVENYDELMEKAKVLNIFHSGPFVFGGHLECFFVMDPNGVRVQIARA